MSIGNIGSTAMMPLTLLASGSGVSKSANTLPAQTSHAQAPALGQEKDGDKDKDSSGVGKQVNVLA